MKQSLHVLKEIFLSPPMLLRSLPLGVVIAVGVVATAWTQSLLKEHEGLVVHTHDVITTTKDVLIGLDDAETGERGFLLSGDLRYLDPYAKALTRLSNLRSDLEKSISDNKGQRDRVDRLNHLVDEKLEQLKQSISRRGQDGMEAARALELSWMETATMDQIRVIIGQITDEEKMLLSERQVVVENDEYRVKLVAILVALLSFLTRVGIEIYLVRSPKYSGS